MNAVKKIKVAMVGLMTRPFHGPKEDYFREDALEIRDVLEGLNTELILFDKGIFDLESARAAAKELDQEGIDLLLLQCSSFSNGDFIYPFLELHTHFALWSIPEGEPTDEGGLPLNSLTAMNMYNSIIKIRVKREGEPLQWFFGRAKDENFKNKFDSLIRSLYAKKNLCGARIGLIGGVAQGFNNLIVDTTVLRSKTGVNLVEYDLKRIYTLADSISDENLINKYYSTMINQTKSFSHDLEKFFRDTARFQAAFNLFVEQNELDAIALSCWPGFQEDRHLAVCTLMGQLNDTGIVSSCEGDVPGAVGMLTLHLLSQGKITTIMDMVTMDPDDDSILLWHCGPSAPSLADNEGVQMQSLWLFDNDPNGPIGLHNNLRLKPGPATVLGFYPDFSKMLLVEGNLDNEKPSYVGSSAWMRDLQVNGKDVNVNSLLQIIMDSGYQHHYPLIHGRYGRAAQDLACLLGLKIISSHA